MLTDPPFFVVEGIIAVLVDWVVQQCKKPWAILRNVSSWVSREVVLVLCFVSVVNKSLFGVMVCMKKIKKSKMVSSRIELETLSV
jgi:tRNA A58 N-methylase Trm61